MAKDSESQEKKSTELDLGILPDLVGYNLHIAEIYSYQGFIKALSNPLITAKRFPILVILQNNHGISQSTLGKSLGMDRATAMAIIKNLLDNNLIYREKSTVDKRKYALYLTELGQKTVVELQNKALQYEDKITQSLSQSETLKLKALLKKISHNFKKDSNTAPLYPSLVSPREFP